MTYTRCGWPPDGGHGLLAGLPLMVPADHPTDDRLDCWARRDRLPPYGGPDEPAGPYGTACGRTPATDLGLCARHLATLFPPEVRVASTARKDWYTA
jgi:hypothetical protein